MSFHLNCIYHLYFIRLGAHIKKGNVVGENILTMIKNICGQTLKEVKPRGAEIR